MLRLSIAMPVLLLSCAVPALAEGTITDDKPMSNPLSAQLKETYEKSEQARKNRWPERQWTMAGDAAAFVERIGRVCLSSPDASLAPRGRTLKIIDEPRCALDIEAASKKWKAGLRVTAIHIAMEAKPDAKRALREKFKADDFGTFSRTPHCPCWILQGPKQDQVAEALRK